MEKILSQLTPDDMFEECARERRTVVPKSVKEISASENPTAHKPVLVLLAGAAGAGKTTFVREPAEDSAPGSSEGERFPKRTNRNGSRTQPPDAKKASRLSIRRER